MVIFLHVRTLELEACMHVYICDFESGLGERVSCERYCSFSHESLLSIETSFSCFTVSVWH